MSEVENEWELLYSHKHLIVFALFDESGNPIPKDISDEMANALLPIAHREKYKISYTIVNNAAKESNE